MLSLVASLLLAGAVQAETPATGQTVPPVQAVAPEPEETKIQCRRQRVVGSNRPVRICRTVADWNSLADQTQQQLSRTGVLDEETLKALDSMGK